MVDKMKIVFSSPEIYPFVKTGGLADVSGSLPKEISKLGHNIILILPKYKQISDEKYRINLFLEDLEVPFYKEIANVFETRLPSTQIPVYLISNDKFYDRDQLYNDYEDNLERFSFFSLAILELLKKFKYTPDIFHCNDWQTSMIPVYLQLIYKSKGQFKKSRTLLTIHNLGYQGIFNKSKFSKLGIDKKYFHFKYLEYYDKINLLKGGLVFSDALNTVSEKYSEEIQTAEFGFGLDGVLKERKSDLYGILNGIDYEVWNPETDPNIWKNYNRNNLEDKKINKINLQKANNLPTKDIPLFSIISRLVSQKGIDLIIDILDILIKLDLQLIILGTGTPEYEKKLIKISQDYPDKISTHIEFNSKKAHQIEAGADIFLMPSYYEPCGLNQMISLKYGTVPLVRETGGLADSITDINKSEKGNGFTFQEYDGLKLLKTMVRAMNTYKNKQLWKKIMLNGMNMDFSFYKSAKKYESLYYRLLSKEISDIF